MEIPHSHRSFLLTDTINSAHTGWMRGDLIKSYNMAHLAVWRATNFGLWITADEECFLTVALKHPPQAESRL